MFSSVQIGDDRREFKGSEAQEDKDAEFANLEIQNLKEIGQKAISEIRNRKQLHQEAQRKRIRVGNP